MIKTCRVCQVPKDDSEFGFANQRKSPGRLKTICKGCEEERRRQKRAAGPPKLPWSWTQPAS